MGCFPIHLLIWTATHSPIPHELSVWSGLSVLPTPWHHIQTTDARPTLDKISCFETKSVQWMRLPLAIIWIYQFPGSFSWNTFLTNLATIRVVFDMAEYIPKLPTTYFLHLCNTNNFSHPCPTCHLPEVLIISWYKRPFFQLSHTLSTVFVV